MGMWNNYKEELDAAKVELATLKARNDAAKVELATLKARNKELKKRAKKAEKLLAAVGHRLVSAVPEIKKAENIIQKLAESLDAGGGMTSASKLGSWRAARTAEYRSQQNALTMGPIGSLDSDTN